jgi:hypothetical protein
LTSEHLGDISIKQLRIMTTFHLILNEQSFEIHSSYLSCLSNQFQSLDKRADQLICSIPQEHFQCFESFLLIFKGSSFRFDEFDLSSLIYYFDLKPLHQFISSSLSLPSNIQESISFLSRMNSQLLDKHFQQSIDILVENIEKISIDQYL